MDNNTPYTAINNGLIVTSSYRCHNWSSDCVCFCSPNSEIFIPNYPIMKADEIKQQKHIYGQAGYNLVTGNCGQDTEVLKSPDLPKQVAAKNDRRRISGGINGAFAAIIASDDEPFRFLERTIREAKLNTNKSFEYSNTIWGTSGDKSDSILKYIIPIDLLARLHWINWEAMGLVAPAVE
uniref:Peptidase A1 domain-containing protein n=1 Tax=Meloidogyne hapla TaxID=6305 RepID=A0A1I8BZI6_MELHA